MGRMGPRLFGIPAGDADTVAIIRRGPSGWCHVSRWEPARGALTAGSWLRGTIYPQRCDLSPDGRWFVYLALKPSARWSVGATYLVVSRLPWLRALAAWSTCGTWTRGLHFVPRGEGSQVGNPDNGDIAPLMRRYGLAPTRPETFAVERRRGWREAETTPMRQPGDHWDEQRADAVVMEKPRPGRATELLQVSGRHAAFRDNSPAWGQPSYAIVDGAVQRQLDAVQWADWDRAGRLLVATRAGQLEVRDEPFSAADIVWSADLAPLRPDPQAPPPESGRWS